MRSPHHTASSVSLVGGGAHPIPGEITLAHRGALFLDEFPEFQRQVLEVLRQPLEDGVVTIARARGAVTFPAKFILIAAQNPCPCGYYGDAAKICECSPAQRERYKQKISGPLLDRIDLQVVVPRQSYEKLKEVGRSEKSEVVRKRVEAARFVQYARYGKSKTNSEMHVKDIARWCKLDAYSDKLLSAASRQYNFSGRTIHRILKVARTIADLAGSERLEQSHVAEAIHLRIRQE